MKDIAGQSESEARGIWISLRELAAEWSASRQTVRRTLERAGIRPVYLNDASNGTLRYSREEVQRFMDRCRKP